MIKQKIKEALEASFIVFPVKKRELFAILF